MIRHRGKIMEAVGVHDLGIMDEAEGRKGGGGVGCISCASRLWPEENGG